jgi:hypothetical protein
MKTFALVALVVGAAAGGACGEKPAVSSVDAATPDPSKLIRKQTASRIGARVADPTFGCDYLVGQIGLIVY